MKMFQLRMRRVSVWAALLGAEQNNSVLKKSAQMSVNLKSLN